MGREQGFKVKAVLITRKCHQWMLYRRRCHSSGKMQPYCPSVVQQGHSRLHTGQASSLSGGDTPFSPSWLGYLQTAQSSDDTVISPAKDGLPQVASSSEMIHRVIAMVKLPHSSLSASTFILKENALQRKHIKTVKECPHMLISLLETVPTPTRAQGSEQPFTPHSEVFLWSQV